MFTSLWKLRAILLIVSELFQKSDNPTRKIQKGADLPKHHEYRSDNRRNSHFGILFWKRVIFEGKDNVEGVVDISTYILAADYSIQEVF